MKLPIKFPFQKKDDSKYYLSLLLADDKAHATVFAEKNETIEVIGEHEQNFESPIEEITDEDLITTLDKAISNAESKLPNGLQTQKTIFGVKENWIEETKIKKGYLARLKKVCDALGLTPIGFLVIHEAVAHLLQKEEGAPVSAILAEVTNHDIAVSILRGGKVLETRRVHIDGSIPKTIDKTLHFFTNYEILPSRIIVFNERNHEKLSQELIGHQWSKSLPFLHVPQIKILPHKFEARAILFGAATQMGFEVLDKFDMPTIPSIAPISEKNDETAPDEKDDSMFGFVSDEDVAKADEKESTPEQLKNDTVEEYNQEFFESEHKAKDQESQKRWQTKFHHMVKSVQNTYAYIIRSMPVNEVLSRFPMLTKRKGLIFIPPLIIGVLLAIFLLYVFALKATVVIHISPKNVQKSQNIIFSTSSTTDSAKNIIAAESVSTTETGSVDTTTTGKKEIGEKAKGSITILSSLTKEQTIPDGTTITAANGLIFILNNAVKVASSSGVSDIKSVSGSVTSKDIGKEYNLPSGTKFGVGGFDKSSVEAKNDSPFSGGSKKEIQVVAKADITKLTEELPKELEEKAKKDLQTKIKGEKQLLPVFISTTIDKKTLSKNIGDEATSVTLKGVVTFDAAAYMKSDVEKFGLDLLSKQDQNLTPSKESLHFSVSSATEKNGEITAKTTVKGFLIPKIEKDKITETIAGTSFEHAKQSLTTISTVKNVEIMLHPGLPFLPHLLPRISKNITVVIQTDE